MIRFRVYGIPKGQPRPRAFARKIGDKFTARVYDAGTAEGWKGDVAIAAREHLGRPITTAVEVTLIFLLPRPKRLCRKKDDPARVKHVGKPDVDNLAKAVMDCLTQIGAWGDDAGAWRLVTEKWYHAIGEAPGAEVSIEGEPVESSPAAFAGSRGNGQERSLQC